jgi:Hemerythrin HHE cation binding domain
MKARPILVGAAVAAAAATAIRSLRRRPAPTGPADIGFMLAMHAAFRRDLARLEQTADAAGEHVLAGWEVLSRRLVVHHQAEDDDLWPVLQTKTDAPAVEEIVAEHEHIADALQTVDSTLRNGGDRRRVAREFAQLVRAHLDHEEREVLPLVEQHLSAQEWRTFLLTERNRQTPRSGAEFIAWVLDDAEPADARAIWKEIPAPAKVVYRLVMKPLYDRRHLWETDATDHATHNGDQRSPQRGEPTLARSG